MAINLKSLERNVHFKLCAERYGDNETLAQLVSTRTRAHTLREALNKQAATVAAEGDLTDQGLQKRMQGIREQTKNEITQLRESVVARARVLVEPLRPTVKALDDAKLNRLINWWQHATFDQRMKAIGAAIQGKDDDIARAILTEPRHFNVTHVSRALIEERFVPEATRDHVPEIKDLATAARLVDEELGEIEQELS